MQPMRLGVDFPRALEWKESLAVMHSVRSLFGLPERLEVTDWRSQLRAEDFGLADSLRLAQNWQFEPASSRTHPHWAHRQERQLYRSDAQMGSCRGRKTPLPLPPRELRRQTPLFRAILAQMALAVVWVVLVSAVQHRPTESPTCDQ